MLYAVNISNCACMVNVINASSGGHDHWMYGHFFQWLPGQYCQWLHGGYDQLFKWSTLT